MPNCTVRKSRWIAGNLIAFRLPDGYNIDKGKEDAHAEKDSGL